uniref:ATP-binding protein n=1 Tax=Cytobacillus oceanisediminis TaxID=665099 RepID=UPI00373650F1
MQTIEVLIHSVEDTCREDPECYEEATTRKRGSIILTSNKGFGEWGEMVGNPIIATAMLDRLLHHSWIFNLKGNSYRLKEKQMKTQKD